MSIFKLGDFVDTLEFSLAEGTATVLVEVAGPVEDSLERAGFTAGVTRKASITFEKALATIRPTAETIVSQFSGLENPPAEISLSFGLKLTANTSAKIVSAGSESHLDVTVKWVTKA